MKAVRMHRHGGVDQLVFEDAEEPRCDGAGQAIVKLRAAALNRIDIWNRLGLTGAPIRRRLVIAETRVRVDFTSEEGLSWTSNT